MGTLIALGPGLGEVPEMAKLLGVEEESLRDLERGQGIVSGLTKDWARSKPILFKFNRMRSVSEDHSIALREASAARYTQTIEQAESGYQARQAQIMQVMGVGAVKVKEMNEAKRPKRRSARSGGEEPLEMEGPPMDEGPTVPQW